jgi:septum formation protein
LLSSIGLEFDVVPADVDESVRPGESPVDYVERVAAEKARVVARRIEHRDDVAVLAADTCVDAGGQILGKPVDDDDARRMLRLLSGTTHQVHTAVVARRARDVHPTTVTTGVTFARLSDAGIDWYLSMGEHVDKAGAYGMQGAAAALVHRIDGSPTNVIGLPLAETIGVLRACGVAVVGS